MIAPLSGLVAGMIHVWSGPDHLAAVAPLAVEHQRNGWRTGVRWGLGHAGGVLIVGLLSLTFRGLLPLEKISAWAEWSVGVVLISVGLWGLRRAWSSRLHVHEHSHGGDRHIHLHFHFDDSAHRGSESSGHRHPHVATAIGTLHGIAGSSHFLGVVPALALPDFGQAAAYLLAYGVGTVAAMGLFAGVVARAARTTALRPVQQRGWMVACSALAVGIGVCWLVGGTG